MVTAFLQLYHGLTLITALPAFVFGLLEEAVRFFILRTLS